MVRGQEIPRVIPSGLMSFPEGNPSRCERFCGPIEQTSHWRAVTEIGLNSFIQNGFRSTVQQLTAFEQKPLEEGGFLVDMRAIDVPGVLWTSPDPEFAISMGLMRAITENQTTYLLGVNHCRHESRKGVRAYKAVGVGRKKSILYPLDNTYEDRTGLTLGTVFNRFSQEQVQEGVLYTFDPRFIEKVSAACAKYPYSGENADKSISTLIHSAIFDFAYEAGTRERFSVENILSEVFLAFLLPAQAEGLPTRDIAPAVSVIRNDLETDFLQNMFIEKLLENRRAELLKKAQRVVYFGLGAAKRHEQIEKALLEIRKRIQGTDTPNPELVREEADLSAMQDVMNRFIGFSPGETPFADFEERNGKS